MVNRWNKIGRPGIYLERGTCKRNVVPFDGDARKRFAKEQYYGR